MSTALVRTGRHRPENLGDRARPFGHYHYCSEVDRLMRLLEMPEIYNPDPFAKLREQQWWHAA